MSGELVAWRNTAGGYYHGTRRPNVDPSVELEPLYIHPAPTCGEVLEMRLCEQNHVILKPDQLYRFTVDPECSNCRAFAGEKS